jgi:hypothetical protein
MQHDQTCEKNHEGRGGIPRCRPHNTGKPAITPMSRWIRVRTASQIHETVETNPLCRFLLRLSPNIIPIAWENGVK